jgi:hypothetical protein
MRQTRRGASLTKRGPVYVCPTAEAGRGQRTSADPHTYVQAWTADELRARPLPMNGTDYHHEGEE